MGISRGGICRERPRERKSGRRGVRGLAMMVWSSFDVRSGSRNLGDGSRRGVLSERERALGDFAFCGVRTEDSGAAAVASLSSMDSGLPLICISDIIGVNILWQLGPVEAATEN